MNGKMITKNRENIEVYKLYFNIIYQGKLSSSYILYIYIKCMAIFTVMMWRSHLQ